MKGVGLSVFERWSANSRCRQEALLKHTVELIDTQTREISSHIIETETADGFLELVEDLRDKQGEKDGTTYLVHDVTRGDNRG